MQQLTKLCSFSGVVPVVKERVFKFYLIKRLPGQRSRFNPDEIWCNFGVITSPKWGNVILELHMPKVHDMLVGNCLFCFFYEILHGEPLCK